MKAFKNLIFYICVIVFTVTILFPVYYRFIHPELTETQLFLKLWWIIFPLIISVIGIKSITTQN